MRKAEEMAARPALRDDRVVVYRRFSSMLLQLCLSLAVFALGLWMALTPPSTNPSEALAPLAGVFLVALCPVWAGVSVLWLIFIRRPALVIDHGGIDVRIAGVWPVHVAWRNVERITTDEWEHYWVKYHYLHITLRRLKPPNSGYAQSVAWNRLVRRIVGYNPKLGTAHFSLTNWLNTQSGDEIVAQVRERFALELKRYDISIWTDSEMKQTIADFRQMTQQTKDQRHD